MFKHTRLFLFVCAVALPVFGTGCSAEADEELLGADDIDFDALSEDISLPNDLKGVNVSRQEGLGCNKGSVNKNGQATCTKSLPKTWTAEVRPFSTRYTVTCKANTARLVVNPNLSVVSKDIKVGKSAKAVVKGKVDNVALNQQVTVIQGCKITSWKKDAVQ